MFLRHAQTRHLLVWCLLAVINGCTPRTSSTNMTSTDGWRRYVDIPGAQRAKQARKQYRALPLWPTLSDVQFSDDGERVLVQNDAGWRVFDLRNGQQLDVPADELPQEEPSEEDEQPSDTTAEQSKKGQPTSTPAQKRVPRGGQATQVTSPDGQWTATHNDFNVLLQSANMVKRTITTRGTANKPFGTATWVYGEELDQKTAMWFSPDSTLLAFYAFDLTDVPRYTLLHGLAEQRPTVMDSAYPKPGDANPVAGLRLYDIKRRRTIRVGIGNGDDQYIYGISFTPDSRYLLYHRMNRLQNELEIIRVNPKTGASKVLFAESQPTWVDYAPAMRWLDDGQRFLIATEQTGFRTWELWDVDSGQLAVLGPGTFPAKSIVRVDESDSAPGGGTVYFSGYSDAHPLNLQLHAVHLDGSEFKRLTNEPLNHSRFHVSPDGANVIATATDHTTPSRIVLYGSNGSTLATIDEADTTSLSGLDARPSELFSFEAADGQTCFGRLHYPSNFDSSKKWPVLVQVYGGPGSSAVRNAFQMSSSNTELGFVIVQIDNRGTGGRGKAFEGAAHLKLGQVDLDDQARGVAVLAERHDWVDTERVGITGHSYGGYMSVLALLRHPDVFGVAVATAPVTDWRNYDSIYTERYMRTPAENGDNYDAGSCVALAEQLEGKLLLLHGMVDDNVHPTNCWQLAEALQAKDMPFEMQFYPNATHNLFLPASKSAKWSFLFEHLVESK